jgi:hypothetical protein
MMQHRNFNRNHAQGIAIGWRMGNRRMAYDPGASGSINHIKGLA